MTIFQSSVFFNAFGMNPKSIVVNDEKYFYTVSGNQCFVHSILLSLDKYTQEEICKRLFEKERIRIVNFSNFFKKDTFLQGIWKISGDDNITELPSSLDEFIQSLGKKTRQHLKWYKRQLEKDGIQIDKHITNKINTDEVFREVYRLNNERCISKGFEGGARPEWYNVVKEEGGIIYYTCEDVVIAGCIYTICGDTLFLHTIAHDNDFNSYNIGNLILLDTIEFAIQSGVKKFNFLWVACEYKKRFNATNYPLYSLTVYKWLFQYIFAKILFVSKYVFSKLKSEFIVLLKFIYRCLKNVYKLIRGTYPKGIVYMLHRCAPADRKSLWPNENMKVYPDILDKQLVYCKKHYNCIAAKDVSAYCKKPHLKKFVAFTFDDGYLDNFEYALPIFKKHNIPFTVFVAASFPDKTNIMWWYALEELLLSVDKVTLANGMSYICKTTEEKCNAFLEIRLQILQLNQKNLENELNNLFAAYEIDWHKPVTNLSMEWSQIEEMAKDPLVTIGGHTYNHYNLKQLPDLVAVKDDIEKGLITLKQHNIETDIFAYPFGTSNEVSNREIEYLSHNEFGLKCAFLADGGSTTRSNKKRYALPREFLSNKTKM